MHLADAFIQSDLQCIQAIHLYWEKIHGTAFGLNLYLYSPVSSFGSCGHHISILFSQLSIPSCIVVKIATGSALAH